MKKVLLFSIFLLFSACAVFAYETIIIKYPPGENWEKVFYKKYGPEALLQYVPKGQTQQNWTRAIFIHSYEYSTHVVNVFMANELLKLIKNNPTSNYKYMLLHDNDAIAGRCTDEYKGIKAQCEFFRVTRTHGGIITMHYVNRDKEDFMQNFNTWYNAVRKTRYYNSYWRNERTFNKSEYYEL